MIRPIKNYSRITTKFGASPDPGKFNKHLGVDYAAPVGTPIYAPLAGTITAAYTAASGNKIIELRAGGKLRRFLHLSRIDVQVGQFVKEGQRIGLSGATGKVSGPHLHYDVRADHTAWDASFSNYIDPEAELAEAVKPRAATNVGKTFYMPPSVLEWSVYPEHTPLPVQRKNRIGTVNPYHYRNGLSYKIVSNPAPNTYGIVSNYWKSRGYPVVLVYADKDAVIK